MRIDGVPSQAVLIAIGITCLDYLPRKADGDCLQELRWTYDRRDLKKAAMKLAA